MKKTRYDINKNEINLILPELAPFRINQIWHALYEELVDPSQATSLPKNIREMVKHSSEFKSALSLTKSSITDHGLTNKLLFALNDGSLIESVLMHYNRWSTICVSTQAGCAMNCKFCATGQMGFTRHLSRGEILEQIVNGSIETRNSFPHRSLSNIVFMGMGEPLLNYEAVVGAIRVAKNELKIGYRHFTISTVGIVPGILRLADEKNLLVNLAISLHAVEEDSRNELIPINKRYPISAIIDACKYYKSQTNRRISLEYAMIGGVNDDEASGIKLAQIARTLSAHINLIPLNETPEFIGKRSHFSKIDKFRNLLIDSGANATVRQTRGSDIDAACGQLATLVKVKK